MSKLWIDVCGWAIAVCCVFAAVGVAWKILIAVVCDAIGILGDLMDEMRDWVRRGRGHRG